MGLSTALVSPFGLDRLAWASCNPAVGGLAKGHLAREVDALGGLMGRVTDLTGIQFRRLNLSKGPAVRSTRAQIDQVLYASTMRQLLEVTPNLTLVQDEGVSLGCRLDRGARCASGQRREAGMPGRRGHRRDLPERLGPHRDAAVPRRAHG